MYDKIQNITINESTTKKINKNTKETNLKEATASTWDDITRLVNGAQGNTTIT